MMAVRVMIRGRIHDEPDAHEAEAAGANDKSADGTEMPLFRPHFQQ